jgi:pectate lyase
MRRLSTLSIAVACALASAGPATAIPAFPGAQGFGAVATGGRGGQVIKVTTLTPTGPGSLQAALDAAGPRIIVFTVSGIIDGRSLPDSTFYIPHGDVTIAGQTASALGRGITIFGHLYTPWPETFGNIIIRHVRVRPPTPAAGGQTPSSQHDGIQFSAAQKVILDHVDVTHGADEQLDFYTAARDVTVQWSMIGFGLIDVGDGQHNYGIINGPGGGRFSVHHNFFVHNRNRSPAISDGPAESINNVVYNFREGFVHNNPVAGTFNLIGNHFRTGPNAVTTPIWLDPEDDTLPAGYHMSDNWLDHPNTFVGRIDNPFATNLGSNGSGLVDFDDEYTFFCCGIHAGLTAHATAYDYGATVGYVPIATQANAIATTNVFDRAGAYPRDQVATAAHTEYTARSGSWGNRFLDHTQWMNGLPAPSAPPVDTDNDGMPNAWETAQGLNPNVNDSAVVRPSGYTAIEDYINGLADSLYGSTDVIFANGFQ